MSQMVACRNGLEMELPCVWPGHGYCRLSKLQEILGNWKSHYKGSEKLPLLESRCAFVYKLAICSSRHWLLLRGQICLLFCQINAHQSVQGYRSPQTICACRTILQTCSMSNTHTHTHQTCCILPVSTGPDTQF